MITKKQINKVEKRYYIDENYRIIKESKVKNITLSEVITFGEIHELNRLSTKLKKMITDEDNNQ